MEHDRHRHRYTLRKHNKFGKRLRQIREHIGMRQVDLSDKISCQQTTIWRLEEGTQEPSLAIALEIARAFGVTLDAMVGKMPVDREQGEEGEHGGQ